MTTSGVPSYNYSGYSYNNYQNDMLNSSSWKEKAEQEAENIKNSTTNKTSSTSSTSSTKDTGINVNSSASTSTFLLGYQSTLEDLEASAAKLQSTAKDNVFSKYEQAVADLEKNPNSEEYQKKVDQAINDVVAAFKDFADKYNNTLDYLSNNQDRGSGIVAQLESFKRMMPNEKTMKALGMSYDASGKVKVDEEALRENFEKDPSYIKDLMGGQFGIAERIGDKATSVLDSSVDKIIGSNGSSSDGTNSASSSSSASASSSKKASSMSDSFLQFASFAKSGAYNLSNYYAVSMLNMLV